MKENDLVPTGWATTKLGDVLDTFRTIDPKKDPDNAFTYVDIGSIDNRTQRIVESRSFKGASAPSRARRLIRRGDVLFSTVRPYLKNIATVPEELDGSLTSTGISVLRATFAVHPRFLFWRVVSDDFVTTVGRSMDGTLYPAVRDSDVLAAKICLPPLNEQRRIVDKIEALTAKSCRAKEALDVIPPLLERFRQSVLAAAFRGDLTADWRAKNPDVEPADQLLTRIRQERRARWEEADALRIKTGREMGHDLTSGRYREPKGRDRSSRRLPSLPVGWIWTTLDELTHFTVDYRGRTPKKADTGIPLLSSAAIRHDRLRIGPSGYVSEEVYREALTRGVPEPGDVLVTTEAPVGESAVYPDEEVHLLSRRVFACKVGGAASRYVMHALYAPEARQHLADFDRGTTVPRILKPDILATPIPMPPLSEQEEIVRLVDNALDAAHKLTLAVESEAARLRDLDQAILSKAFRGELITQDPKDEPASVLLERIRAEREKASPKKRKTRRKRKGAPASPE